MDSRQRRVDMLREAESQSIREAAENRSFDNANQSTLDSNDGPHRLEIESANEDFGGRPLSEEERKAGVGSARQNGSGFVDLEQGDTFNKIEAGLRGRVKDVVHSSILGISGLITSKKNASEISHHTSVSEDSNAHKFAAKNILRLFEGAQTGIVHADKYGSPYPVLRLFTPYYFNGEVHTAILTVKQVEDANRIYAIEAPKVIKGNSITGTSKLSQDGLSSPAVINSPLTSGKVSSFMTGVNGQSLNPRFIGPMEGTLFTPEALTEKISKDIAEFESSHPLQQETDSQTSTDIQAAAIAQEFPPALSMDIPTSQASINGSTTRFSVSARMADAGFTCVLEDGSNVAPDVAAHKDSSGNIVTEPIREIRLNGKVVAHHDNTSGKWVYTPIAPMQALFEAFRQGAESQDGTESATLRKSMRAAFEKNNLTFPKDISEQGYQNFAQVFNHVLKIATENDMDIAMVDAVWKWVGSDVYDVVHPNSDHQYSSSSEIATIC